VRGFFHATLGAVVVAGIVLAIDPHPFDGPTDSPTAILSSAQEITSRTATTIPPAPTTTRPKWRPTDAARSTAVPTAPPPTTALPPTTVAAASPRQSASASQSAAPAPPSIPTVAPAIVARIVSPRVPVFAQPTDSTPAVVLSSTTDLGSPRVLLTTQVRADWVQVLLPVRPNNAVGWVRARDVALGQVDDSVDVDLASRTLTWTRAGAVEMQVTVAVGAPSTPTPVGMFFVTDVLPASPSGPYGAWVLALNAHSDAFTLFEGGDPRIAIHGTNDPSSIGRAASNGCVRVAAGPLATLAAALAPGTPVIVH
jgi:lipoprotein-anchoring transpeptidase ErfK/SrfK